MFAIYNTAHTRRAVFVYAQSHNARLRGWQRIPLNSNTTIATTAAQWDWKRHALAVPLRRLLGELLLVVCVHLPRYQTPIMMDLD
ncbi:hypothetical protein FXE83_07405 [Vibrio cholerae]|nr:hypothetical protein FXE83_07405 [Vibrio cholerae]